MDPSSSTASTSAMDTTGRRRWSLSRIVPTAVAAPRRAPTGRDSCTSNRSVSSNSSSFTVATGTITLVRPFGIVTSRSCGSKSRGVAGYSSVRSLVLNRTDTAPGAALSNDTSNCRVAPSVTARRGSDTLTFGNSTSGPSMIVAVRQAPERRTSAGRAPVKHNSKSSGPSVASSSRDNRTVTGAVRLPGAMISEPDTGR